MDRLKQVLKQSDTILFIGSGISTWSGLPNWAEMIEELAQALEASGYDPDLVRAEAKRGDLLQAASYGFDKLTKHQIGKFIRQVCNYGKARPKEIHRKIISLGPSCYITTNYDDLIEQSLRLWQSDPSFSTVTNRQLTETADLVHARAINYIFKLHGDAGDLESVILTREHYRKLLPQGERYAALEALKMLLASRPVIYLGFGLRDPDFILLRDVLANTFQGGTRDHFAIMPDVVDAARDYWRDHYGIHLIGYVTKASLDGSRDHSELLTILDGLIETDNETAAPNFDPDSPDSILALARHAAGLMRSEKISNELQLRVHAKPVNRSSYSVRDWLDRFDHSPIETFLDGGPQRTLLIGLPGAGKSYAVRRSAARLAEELHKSCLADTFETASVVVPVSADLKMYRGDLERLVDGLLPPSLPLKVLLKHFQVKVFLDAFNEMPREYLESGSYEADFRKFTASLGKSSVVITSRTDDSLERLGLSTYTLDQIDEKDLASELRRLNLNIEGMFSIEVQALLQRPFYFQYVMSGKIRLPKEAHPRNFYRAYLENTRKAFEMRFGIDLDIEAELARVAYSAIDRGEEAFPLAEFLRILSSETSTNLAEIDIREVANWLVSCSMLIPFSGGRIAFVHQSVTEYLAASELARRYQSRPSVLKEKLANTRWDQALFLCLSLLPTSVAEAFLEDVIRAEFTLGLKAAKYLEVGRDEVIGRLLSEIPARVREWEPTDHEIEAAVGFGLPLTEGHESHLRALIALGGSIGAAGVSRLVELKGDEVKDELLQLLVERCSDYNLCCNGVGTALKPFAKDSDVFRIAEWADLIQAASTPSHPSDKTVGFTCGAAEFLSQLEISAIRRGLLGRNGATDVSDIRAQLLCTLLQRRHSSAALDLTGELVCLGITEAATTLYFVANFSEPSDELSWASFSSVHVGRLISMMSTENSWALRALKCLCEARPDLSKVVERDAMKMSGIERGALMYCVSLGDCTPVFQALEAVVEMSDGQRRCQPFYLLSDIDFDWTGREDLYLALLRLRDIALAKVMFGASVPTSVTGIYELSIGSIEWYLEWMMDVWADDDDNNWFLYQLGSFFGEHVSIEVQGEFVSEFNKPHSRFRELLFRFVIPYITDFSTDEFSEHAISFLLAHLSSEEAVTYVYDRNVLGSTATEQFVTDRLLPLLANAEEPLLRNLQAVLRQAGSRHNRRYFVEVPG